MLSGRIPVCHSAFRPSLPLAGQTRKSACQRKTKRCTRFSDCIESLQGERRDAGTGTIALCVQHPDDIDAIARSVGRDAYDGGWKALISFCGQIADEPIKICCRAPESAAPCRRIRLGEIGTYESNNASNVGDCRIDAEADAYSRGRLLGIHLSGDETHREDWACKCQSSKSENVLAHRAITDVSERPFSLGDLAEANQVLDAYQIVIGSNFVASKSARKVLICSFQMRAPKVLVAQSPPAFERDHYQS